MKCSGDFGSVQRGSTHQNRHTGPGSFKPVLRGRTIPGKAFGGVSYQQGDFVTPGTSGLGDIWSDALSTIFGKDGATQVTQTLQSGAAATVKNVIANKLGEDPNSQAAINRTGIEAAKAVYMEYWYVTIPLTLAAVTVIGTGLYGLIKNARK